MVAVIVEQEEITEAHLGQDVVRLPLGVAEFSHRRERHQSHT